MGTVGGLSCPDVPEPLDGVKGVREGHAVCEYADALLEELHRGLGVDAVGPVRLAAGEPEDVKALLELADIVAVKVGEAQVESAVPELVAFVDEQGPRRGVHLVS